MATLLKPGSEIEAFCTSCKVDRVHRIIALVGQTPKKVECLSCKGHHLYRATAAAKEAAAAHKRASKGTGASTGRPTRASIAMSAKKREAEDLVATWEKSVAGKPYEQFKPYKTDKTFAKGELIRHAKFGDGVILQILDANKFEVLFKDGTKMLAQSIPLAS